MPVFEGRWACSPACLDAMVEGALRREGKSRASEAPAPRMPLGLMLLDQGSISGAQLREAMDRQSRHSGDAFRLETWLLNSGVLTEAALSRAISAQWSCPVFTLAEPCSGEMASALPSFLAEALGALPVRVSGVLYLAFSERIDRSLSYAVEHMTGLRVAAGIARESEFRREQARFFSFRSPKTRFFAADESKALMRGLAAALEEARPVEARLARVHDLWWLRIWRRGPGGGRLPAWDAVEDWLTTADGQRGDRELEETAALPIRRAEGSEAACRE